MTLVRSVKNIIIVLLGLLSIYLTGQLWFENISSRNFFSFLDSVVYQTTEEDRSGIVVPYRIITNLGNKSFSVIYNNIAKSVQKADADQILEAVLGSGEFVEARNIDWDDMLKNRSYIYQYKKPISPDVFARGLGQKGNLLSRISSFNNIIIIPASLADEKIRVLFVDIDNNTYYEYTLTNRPAFNNVIRNMQTSQDNSLSYISSAQMGLVMLKENVFIPSWAEGGYQYNAVSVINPYIKTDRLRNVIGEKVDLFFNNPTAKRSDTINGVYTYAEADIVVKYYTSDILEYYDYSATDARVMPSLTRDYNLAVNFINKDINVVNEYYLAYYETDYNNGTTILYFDYAINNMPVLFTPQYAVEIGMDHFIEITIENGKVYKYKKLVYNLQPEQSLTETATVDFFNSLDSIFSSEQHINESNLSGVELGYRLDSGKTLLLSWFLDIDGRRAPYVQSAQRR